jgi:hypothetical protein
VNDKLVPVICVIAPILSYLFSLNAEKLLGGYKVSIEILIVNGIVTFLGLWLVSKKTVASDRRP